MQVRILPADSWSTLNDTKQEGRLYLMEKIHTDTSMDAAERLRRQMAFCLEIDKEKFIGRQTYLSDGERKKMTRNTPGIWRS